MTIKIKGHGPVSIAGLIQAVKRTRKNPKAEFNRSFLSTKPTTGEKAYREYLNCLHGRITAGVPIHALIQQP